MKIAASTEQIFTLGLVLAALALFPGCAAQQQATETGGAAPAAYSRPDGFPNLNVPIAPATRQLEVDEKESLARELAAKRRPGAAVAGNRAAEQRRLAQERQAAMLREIEAGEGQ